MSIAQNYGIPSLPVHGGFMSSYETNNFGGGSTYSCNNIGYYNPYISHFRSYDSWNQAEEWSHAAYDYNGCTKPEAAPSSKRRKLSSSAWGNSARQFEHSDNFNALPSWHTSTSGFVPSNIPSTWDACTTSEKKSLSETRKLEGKEYDSTTSCKRDRPIFEDVNDSAFMSKDEIERCSPSRKHGIDAMHEAQLRFSYCAFLQNLGMRLELPQTTIGTAMVLCHRFFIRRSHACNDRFLIATATLFLAAKSEESARPLNNVLQASCEILHNHDFNILSYMLPMGWFEKYRERIIEAEQLILTTLNFELDVQHPFAPLTSTLEKLGYSQSILVHLALSLVSEGLRTSLWLQFKPHEIAAGAAYLAAKLLNMDLGSCHHVWREFKTPPSVLKDIAQQLMELA